MTQRIMISQNQFRALNKTIQIVMFHPLLKDKTEDIVPRAKCPLTISIFLAYHLIPEIHLHMTTSQTLCKYWQHVSWQMIPLYCWLNMDMFMMICDVTISIDFLWCRMCYLHLNLLMCFCHMLVSSMTYRQYIITWTKQSETVHLLILQQQSTLNYYICIHINAWPIYNLTIVEGNIVFSLKQFQ